MFMFSNGAYFKIEEGKSVRYAEDTELEMKIWRQLHNSTDK